MILVINLSAMKIELFLLLAVNCQTIVKFNLQTNFAVFTAYFVFVFVMHIAYIMFYNFP